MKNKIITAITAFTVLLTSTLIFEGCKKGEDDPSISFHSRKARVAGDWEVVSYKYTYNYNSTTNPSWNSNTIYTMNGSTYTEISTNATGTTTKNGTNTWKWTFKKEGSYDFTSTIDGKVETSKGTWNFTSGVGDLKNKSQITYYAQNYTSSTGTSTWTGNYIDAAFDIVELRNKKMIWHVKSAGTSTTSNSSYEEEIEFEAK